MLDVAVHAGYGTLSAFNRAFRRAFGMNAAQYRARHAREEIPE